MIYNVNISKQFNIRYFELPSYGVTVKLLEVLTSSCQSLNVSVRLLASDCLLLEEY